MTSTAGLERRAAVAVAGLALAAVAVGAAVGLGRPADPVILDELALASYWSLIVSALTNIRKHAPPDRVELRLSYESDGTRLIVEDFQALEHPAPPGGGTGYGLTGMRERAELLEGTFTADRRRRDSEWNCGLRDDAAIRILPVDDQRIVREGLATLLGLLDGVEVVGAAGDGEEPVQLPPRCVPMSC
jgi:signal transduction histidine kinase